MNKEELRRYMLTMRKSIPNKEKISTIIVNKIFDLDVYKRAKVIALYHSLASEVNTFYLIKDNLNKKIVLLPKVINNKIEFIIVNDKTLYQKSKIGVMEPISNTTYDGDIDLIIVPGVSFDEILNRLGFGKGYYDKFLKNKDIYKIGLCFEKQVIKKLPTNQDDIKMDLVVTETRIIKKV